MEHLEAKKREYQENPSTSLVASRKSSNASPMKQYTMKQEARREVPHLLQVRPHHAVRLPSSDQGRIKHCRLPIYHPLAIRVTFLPPYGRGRQLRGEHQGVPHPLVPPHAAHAENVAAVEQGPLLGEDALADAAVVACVTDTVEKGREAEKGGGEVAMDSIP